MSERIIELDAPTMSQHELDYWENELKNRTDEDSKIIMIEIKQEQNTRNELFDELDL